MKLVFILQLGLSYFWLTFKLAKSLQRNLNVFSNLGFALSTHTTQTLNKKSWGQFFYYMLFLTPLPVHSFFRTWPEPALPMGSRAWVAGYGKAYYWTSPINKVTCSSKLLCGGKIHQSPWSLTFRQDACQGTWCFLLRELLKESLLVSKNPFPHTLQQ